MARPGEQREPDDLEDRADDVRAGALEARADDEREPGEPDDRRQPVTRAARDVGIEPGERRDQRRSRGRRSSPATIRASRRARCRRTRETAARSHPEHGDPGERRDRARELGPVADQPGHACEHHVEERRGEEQRRREVALGGLAHLAVLEVLEERRQGERVGRGDADDQQRGELAAPAEQDERQGGGGPGEQPLIGRRVEMVDLADETDRRQGEAVEERDQHLAGPPACRAARRRRWPRRGRCRAGRRRRASPDPGSRPSWRR